MTLRELLFPARCVLCGRLIPERQWVCDRCDAQLERTHLDPAGDNALVRAFWGHEPVVRAMGVLQYRVDSSVSDLLVAIKYQRRRELARKIGRWMAGQLPEAFFEGIDALIPMPLTPERQAERGYNQSEQLALGLQDVTGLPVRMDVVERTSFRISQTRLMGQERRDNVRNAFRQTEDYAEACRQGQGLRHPLLIDDVITTGASISALCAAVAPPQVSFLSLALAGHHPTPYASAEDILREQELETTSVEVMFQ